MTGNAGFLLHNPRGQLLLGFVLLVLVATATYFLTSGSGGNGSTTGSSVNGVATGSFGNVTQPALDTAVEGLCEVRTQFGQNNLISARNVFYDKAHLFLHQLAAEVQAKDIDQATSLLVAKYEVENLLPANGADVTPATSAGAAASSVDAVTTLIAQVQKSAAVLGFKAPNCSQ